MSVLEALTEEEAYLLAILTDESGLDQAEFLWHAPDQDHYGCFRAWPYQRSWWRNMDTLQIDQCARSSGKSLSIQVRACAFPVLHSGHEMVITAPEGNHLQAVTDLIETRLKHNRFYSELLLANANQGVTHRPFLAKFRNGSRIMGRIPQRDGRGIKGTHPLWLEMDEAQDYPSPGWTEIIETLKQGNPDARWRAHGVTKGIRDEFWKFTQEGSDWFVHRYAAMWRPTWTTQEREEKIAMYGSANHPDYRRNVLGKHGDVANPLFVLTRLMRCVDLDPASEYNENVYHKLQLNAEMIEDRGGEILNAIDLPMSHRQYKTTWAGMDVGYTTDPTEILVFTEDEKAPGGDSSMLRLVSRFRLERISTTDQAKLVLWLFDFYNLNAFAMDKTGNGLPLFQLIQQQAETGGTLATRVIDKELIKGYNFSEKILVDFDQSIPVEEMDGDVVSDAGIKRQVLEYACVDVHTKCFTKSGWKHHVDLVVGEEILTLNPQTDRAEWHPLQRINLYMGAHEVLDVQTRSFSSVSTMNHRWWTERAVGDRRLGEWRTTESLVNASAVPILREGAGAQAPTHSDDFVRSVAWAFTEGWWGHSRTETSCGFGIWQSNVNPDCQDNIDSALRAFSQVSVSNNKGGKLWWISAEDARQLETVLSYPHKQVSNEFITSLTEDQARLFVEVAMMADNNGERAFSQKMHHHAEAFLNACVIAGIPARLSFSESRMQWTVQMLKRRNVTPINTGKSDSNESSIEARMHNGVVWCPTVQNSTWLAMRDGKIYFTGNSDKLREYVDTRRLMLPDDRELIQEFQGQTYTYDKGGMDMYGRKRFSKGSFHALDAARMAALAHAQFGIEAFMREYQKVKQPEPVYDIFSPV